MKPESSPRRTGPAWTLLLAAGLLAWPAGRASAQTCGTTQIVRADGTGNQSTIQAAVNALESSLTADNCVRITDAETYSERVTIQNKTNNDYRIWVIADNPLSTGPVVNPPTLSTAAFFVLNDSVTIKNIAVISTNAVSYGIYSSSAYVILSSVTVDSGNKIAWAGVRISSWTTLTYSSITSQNSHGLWVVGSTNTISYSSVTIMSAPKHGLYIAGGSSNTIFNSTIHNASGTAAYFSTGSHSNVVDMSTFAANNHFGFGLYLTTSSFNTVIRSFVMNSSGTAGYFDSGSNSNVVEQSTFAARNAHSAMGTTRASYGLALYGARNSVARSSFTNEGARGIYSGAAGRYYAYALDVRGFGNHVAYSTAVVSEVYSRGGLGSGQGFAHAFAFSVSGGSNTVFAGRAVITRVTGSAGSNNFADGYLYAYGFRLDGSSHTILSNSVLIASATSVGGSQCAGRVYLYGMSIAAASSNVSSNTVVISSMTTQGGTATTFSGSETYAYALHISTGGNVIANNSFEVSTFTLFGQSSDRAFAFSYPGYIASGANENVLADNTFVTRGASEGNLSDAQTIALLVVSSRTTLLRNIITNENLEPNLNSYYGLFLGAADNRLVGGSVTSYRSTAVYVAAGRDISIEASTITAGAAGVHFDGTADAGISGSYVQGSTGVFITASTGSIVNANVLVATGTGAPGISLQGGSAGLKMSSNTLSSLSRGGGVFLGAGNSGVITISTNTFLPGGYYGLYLLSQTTGTALWITSNTVQPTLTAAHNSYGFLLSGLTSGATIQNNLIAHRAPGAASLRSSYGLYATNTRRVNIDHNRFNNPGMVVSGSHTAVYVNATEETQFKFNDVHSSGTGLGLSYLLRLVGSTLTVRDNVFVSSVTVTVGSATLHLSANSGIDSDYNDWYSSNSLNSAVWGARSYEFLAGWQALGKDAGSITGHPRWANTAGDVEDFHPLSKNGRWTLGGFVKDAVDSPTIDKGEPLEEYALEPERKGGRVNQGSYGNTAEASKSRLPGACGNGFWVMKDGSGDYTSIQAAVNSLPVSLSTTTCVMVGDTHTYSEQVTVQNFTSNGYLIKILSDPQLAVATATINPPQGSTAAFALINDSVTIQNLLVIATNTVAYGVYASSSGITVSSITIDGGNSIQTAGVLISSAGMVALSSVSVSGAHGIWIAGSTVSISLSSAASASKAGLYADRLSSITIDGSYIQGSSGVYVAGSTGTAVRGSALVATNAGANALWLGLGSRDLTAWANQLSGGAAAAGIRLEEGGQGTLDLSSNTVKAASRYGVYVATQSAGAVVWIASNTILPSVSTSFDTCGLCFNGLTSGATAHNNAVYYRTAGSMGAFTSAGLQARSASGLLLRRNRVNNPGMVTAGSYVGADLYGVAQSELTLNDFHSTGASLADGYALRLQGSTISARSNVFSSSFSVTGSSASLRLSLDSGIDSEYNDWHSSNTLNVFVWGPTAQPWPWNAATGKDAGSVSGHPRWAQTAAGVEDFHPLSRTGRYLPTTGAYIIDPVHSVTIDAADPAETYALESDPHGSRANSGSYGGTAEASKSALTGCNTNAYIKQDGSQDYPTISQGVASIPSSLAGDACVIVSDSLTYSEQVTVQNKAVNGYRIRILAGPSVSPAPVVTPPTPSTAAFHVLNDSVTIAGLAVVTSNTVNYGILVSSAYATLSSVTVTANGYIATSGVRISSLAYVEYSFVSAGNADGIWLAGSSSTVTNSTATAASTARYGLRLLNVSSNTIMRSYIQNDGHGAYLGSYSSYNAVNQSTIAAALTNGYAALYLTVASSNSFTDSFFTAKSVNSSHGAYITSGGGHNFIARSTMTGTSSGYGLYVNSSSNTIADSYIQTVNAGAAFLTSFGFNMISKSTMVATGSSSMRGLEIVSSSSNTISDCYMASPTDSASYGAYLSGAVKTWITRSTITADSSSGYALVLSGAALNTITQSYVGNTAGAAVLMQSNSNYNNFSQSTMTASVNYGFRALGANSFNDVSSCTIISPWGITLQSIGSAKPAWNSFSHSVLSANNTAGIGLYLAGASSHVITGCTISNLAGHAVWVTYSSSYNVINQSTITSNSTVADRYAVYFQGGDSNSISESYVQGSTAIYVAGATNTVISASVIVATNSFGSAVWVGLQSRDLLVTSSTLRAGAFGRGVYLDQGNDGLLRLSTNTILAPSRYGIAVSTQPSNATVWITSNTILRSPNTVYDSYGIYLDGLSGGATIQNNEVYFRTSGSAGARTAYGLYGVSVSSLNIDHNRFSNPGMVTAGGHVAAYFTGASHTQFKFNDVHATGTGLDKGYLLQLAGSTVAIRNNVFLSSFTAGGAGSTATLHISADSGLDSDYNDLFSSATLGGAVMNTGIWGKSYQLPAEWSGATGKDANSIDAQPHWHQTTAGTEDFHPKTTTLNGRWQNGSFSQTDTVDSPALDASDDTGAACLDLEPFPDGGRGNLGSYGCTAQASMSSPYSAVPGCGLTKNVVKAGGGHATSISAALALIPTTLAVNSCVVVRDTETYSEQVTVQGYAAGQYRLKILGDGVYSSTAVVVNPPAFSTAAFHVLNDSVTISNLLVRSTNSVTYGIYASSAYVTLSSVNVDSGGKIAWGGVRVSSLSLVEYSSVTVQNAHGLWLAGSTVTVRWSTASASGLNHNALRVIKVTSTTITNSHLRNSGYGGYFAEGAHRTLIELSTVTATASGYDGLYVENSSSFTLRSSYFGGERGAVLQAGSNHSVVSSTFVGLGSGGWGLYHNGSTWGTIESSRFIAKDGYGLYLQAGSHRNTIVGSTVTCDSYGSAALYVTGADSNTITGSFIENTVGHGAMLEKQSSNTSDNNVIRQSTVASRSLSPDRYGLYIKNSYGTVVLDSYVQGSTAVYVSGSSRTVIGGSVIIATNTGGSGVWAAAGGEESLSLSSNVIRTGGAYGAGVYIDRDNAGRIIISTNVIYGAGRIGIHVSTQLAGAAVWITSNTIRPALPGFYDSYGIVLDGLQTGATIQNNGIYFRTSGGTAGRTYYAVYLKTVRKVNVDHNRLNNPDMITAGSHVAASFADAAETSFKFNDVHAVAQSSLEQAHLLRASGSTVTVRNNVFLSSITAPSVSSSTLQFSENSGLDSDFNDFFSSATAGGAVMNTGVWGKSYQLASAWSAATGKDASSIASHPYWNDPAAGAEDFHVKTKAPNGRLNPATSAFDKTDTVTSQTIDRAANAEATTSLIFLAPAFLGAEPSPHGSRANQGSYGQTDQASMSELGGTMVIVIEDE